MEVGFRVGSCGRRPIALLRLMSGLLQVDD